MWAQASLDQPSPSLLEQVQPRSTESRLEEPTASPQISENNSCFEPPSLGPVCYVASWSPQLTDTKNSIPQSNGYSVIHVATIYGAQCVPGPAFSTLQAVPDCVFTTTPEGKHVITTILQTRELRVRKGWPLAQGHMIRKESHLGKKPRFPLNYWVAEASRLSRWEPTAQHVISVA